MVAVVLAAIVAGVSLVVAFAGGGDSSTRQAAGQLPEAELRTLDGDEVNLASLGGEPLVVNFFASWCAPCRAEMPDFQRVSQETLGQVRFVGINTSETDPAAARQLVEQTGVTYTTLVGDDGTVFQAVGGLAMPTTAFVAADGTLLEVHSGILTAEGLRGRIQEHFGS